MAWYWLRAMPFSLQFDAPQRLALIRVTGRVTGQEIARFLTSLTTESAWQPDFDRLWLARDLEALVVGPDDLARVRASREALRNLFEKGRTAVVVSPQMEDVVNLLFREHTPWTVALFPDSKSALAWLGKRPSAGIEAG